MNEHRMGIKTRRAIILSLLLLLMIFLPFTSLAPLRADHPFSSTYTITFDDPIFNTIIQNNTTYKDVQIPNCLKTSEPGNAALPFYSVHILIPDGGSIHDIEIEETHFHDYSYQVSSHTLLPAQEELPFSVSAKPLPFHQNQSWYEQNFFQPSDPYGSVGISYIKGYPVETIHIYPLRYHPNKQQLWFHGKVTITVNFNYQDTSLSSTSNQFLREQSSDANKVKDLVMNPEMVNTYPLGNTSNGASMPLFGDGSGGDSSPLSDSYPGGICDAAETYEYVIVTSNDLADTTGYTYNWSDLLNHREQEDGLSGCIVTVEDIDNCNDYYNETSTFNDSAAHLREFCKDAYLDWNTEYILLGGDWENGNSERQIVPCRIFTDIYESDTFDTLPSDLYFSNLDGDWYDSTYGVWGGGRGRENDKLSEISVGRIPIWSAEMISNAIDKIIWYDNCTDSEWLSSAAFLGGDLGWTATSKQYMEEIRVGDGTWSQYEGFEEWNMAFPDYEIDTSGRYYDADYPSESDAVNAWKNAINNNELSIISHLDHGSWFNTLSLGSGSGLSNSHFFIGTSQACLSGRYYSAIAGSVSFLSWWDDRGAFAMLLNTGYGYGSSASTQGASQQQHKIWWDYFFANQTTNFDNWRLGPAMQYTKDTFSSVIDMSSHSYCYVWYSWNLFGDPAQQLRITVEDNSAADISNPSPAGGSSGVSQALSTLSVTLSDSDGDTVDWTIETSPDIGNNSGLNEICGTKSCSVSGLEYNTVYTWFVNVSDGSIWTNETFTFTTEIDPANDNPVILNPDPANESVDITPYLDSVSIVINDPDGDMFSYTIEGEYIDDVSETGQTNGTKTAPISSSLPFNTIVQWYVNVSDGIIENHSVYVFTTRSAYTPSIPTGFMVETVNRTSISLNWTKDNSADSTLIERHTSSSWSRGEGIILYNGSASLIIDTGLSSGITYYYQAWSFNQTDSVFSDTFSAANNITIDNHPVDILSPSPANHSSDCSLNITFSVDIIDDEGDLMNWTIVLNETVFSQSTLDTNGTKILSLKNLSYNTTYTVWVNATDGFDWTRSWYQFSTELPSDNEAPRITSVSISSSNPLDTSSSFGYENITCQVNDNHQVNSVHVNVTLPDSSSANISLTQIIGSDTWFVNTSFTQVGNYSLRLYALDAKGNLNHSEIELFSLAPNWDINSDGVCDLLDLNAISSVYGLEGSDGWMREDVDNNGKISVLDLAIVSDYYEQGWWT